MQPFSITAGPGPLVAAAVHEGHGAHADTLAHFALNDAERLREEDPFTAELAVVAETRIVGHRSRFEVDLNRPPEKAVYRTPDDAWGLRVWHDEVPEAVVERSMEIYRRFYDAVERVLAAKVQEYGSVVVYDLHSYNHRREGPEGPLADPEANPDVNVGTGTLERARWGPLVDRFMADLRAGAREAGLGDPSAGSGQGLDVRENVRFQGGYFPTWIHDRFGADACVLALEFKKMFMDEWTGDLDRAHLGMLKEALQHTVPGVLEVRAEITEAS